ncbi:unnamed protein product, partial [Amoebophrya sp. A25]
LSPRSEGVSPCSTTLGTSRTDVRAPRPNEQQTRARQLQDHAATSLEADASSSTAAKQAAAVSTTS